MRLTPFTTLAWIGLLGACAGDRGAPSSSTGLRVQVAPLDLPGVGRVCYDVHAENGAGAIVWARGTPGLAAAAGDADALCSDRYGDGAGGDISYVGPCDAGEPDHLVRLWVDSISDLRGGALSDWRDPCPASDGADPGGCTLHATCAADTDTPVVFNLVVMRQANQGFFDVAVNFADVFCSAKLDCAYDAAGTQPITLLAQADGTRGQTAVIGFACTGGPGAAGTELHVNDVTVSCAGGGGVGEAAVPLAITSLADGSIGGFVVHASAAGTQLVPTIWTKTGPDTFDAGQALPGLYNSGDVLARIDADRVFGVSFDTTGSGQGAQVIWSKASGSWQIVRSTAPGSDQTSLNFVRYEASVQRVWTGNTNDATHQIDGYWDIAADGAPAHALQNVGARTGCHADTAQGQVAAGSCGDGQPVAWVGGDVAEELAYDADIGPSPTPTRMLVLEDGSVVGGVQDDLHHHRLYRWVRDGDGDWTRTQLASDPDGTYRADFAAENYYAYSLDGAQTLVYQSAEATSTWTSATLDGAPAAFTLQGLSADDLGEVVVYGLASPDGEAVVAAVGRLGEGGPIALTSLPASPFYAFDGATVVRALGLHGGALWLAGSPLETKSEPVLLWSVPLGGGPVDVTAIGPSPLAESNDIEALRPLQLEPVASLAWDDSNGQDGGAAAIVPFIDGPHTDPVYLQRTAFPTGGGGGLVTTTLDPSIAGNAWTTDPDPSDAVWQYAVYRGTEGLDCAGQPCDELYWNVAIGFDPTVPGCSVHFTATASEATGFADGSTPPATTYPYLAYDVPLTDAAGLVCGKNGLDDGTGGVRSQYTPVDASMVFCHTFDGTSVTTSPGCP